MQFNILEIPIKRTKAKERDVQDGDEVDNIDFLDVTKLGGVERKGKGI